MPSTKENFVRPYAEKWGDEAAEYRWQIRIAAILLGAPALALLVLALLLPVGEGLRVGLLGCSVVLGASIFIIVLGRGRRMNVAAARALGVPVGWKADASPPSKSPAYEEWCRKNGLVPYGASVRFGPARHPH